VTPPDAGSARPPIAGILRSVVLNAVVPFVLYRLTKRFVTDSDAVGLVVAGLFPLVESIVSLIRARRLDPIAVLVLLGIAVSLIALTFGGGVKILLIRESFFTLALGVACFASLLLPRPLMFSSSARSPLRPSSGRLPTFATRPGAARRSGTNARRHGRRARPTRSARQSR
jgi:hypothetical protein